MNTTDIKVPNIQERASELYTPVKPSKVSQICLTCPIPKCKPYKCERYSNELKKIRKEEK